MVVAAGTVEVVVTGTAAAAGMVVGAAAGAFLSGLIPGWGIPTAIIRTLMRTLLTHIPMLPPTPTRRTLLFLRRHRHPRISGITADQRRDITRTSRRAMRRGSKSRRSLRIDNNCYLARAVTLS